MSNLRLRFMISGLAALPLLLLWPPNAALLFACGDKSGGVCAGDRQLAAAVEGEVDGLLRAIRAGWGLEVAGERERCGRFPLPGPNSEWLEEVLMDGRWGAVGVGLRTTFDLSFFPLLSSMTVLKGETLNWISTKKEKEGWVICIVRLSESTRRHFEHGAYKDVTRCTAFQGSQWLDPIMPRLAKEG